MELVAPWPTRMIRVAGWADVATDRAALNLGEDEHLIPWLPGRSRVTAVVSTTQYTIGGDPAARGFVVGASAVFETADGETEVVTIGAITTDVFLSAAPSLTIAVGATLMPLLSAALEADQVSVIRVSPSGAVLDTTWRVVDTQHAGAAEAADEEWTEVLDGVEVLTRLAETSENNLTSSERFGGVGGAWRRVVPGATRTAITQQHVVLSALEVHELRQWLYRRRGPLSPCWVPLGLSLGSVGVETHESNAVLEIDDPGEDGVPDLRQAVIVWEADGAPSVHTIGNILRPGEASVPDGRAWLIGLSPALSASSYRGAQWLVHCRLTDAVTIRWLSPEAAEVALSWLSTPLEVSP